MSELKRRYWKIEYGCVMGRVSTDLVGSECEFEICALEDAEEMTDEELEEVALCALYESGMMEWGY